MKEVFFPETVELICGGFSFGHNKNAEIGKIEYYICNPDCEIGVSAENSKNAYKHQWSSTSSPWTHNKGDATYNIYVVEGSEVEKFLKENGRALLDGNASGKGDGLKIIPKPQSYFDELPENQEGYGTPKPSEQDKTPEDTDKGDGPKEEDKNTNPDDKGNDKTDKNNNNTQTVIVQCGDNTALIVIVCVMGGIMLLAIIVVVILAATGVLFGKKPAKAAEPEEDPEMAAIKAELEAAKKAKELEALKAELAALKVDEASVAEEAPVDETPAE